MTSLRRAEPHDVDAITSVHLVARREAMPWLAVVHTDAETRDWIASVVLPNQEVWVAEAAGEVVGYAARVGAELNSLYILPGHQRQGIGTALLRIALERGPGELFLWTFQRNEVARRFYEQHGFEVVTLTEGAGNEEREPDVRYRWHGGSVDNEAPSGPR